MQTRCTYPVLAGWVTAVVCRALSLQLIITLHYCVIYREHNGVFEQFPSTLKAALPQSECLLTSYFAPRARLHRSPPLQPTRQIQLTNSDSPLVFLPCCNTEKAREKHLVGLWGEAVTSRREFESMLETATSLNAKQTHFLTGTLYLYRLQWPSTVQTFPSLQKQKRSVASALLRCLSKARARTNGSFNYLSIYYLFFAISQFMV